ncbi:putative Ig domain-containing protein [Corallococcus carmarthensis]|uniref:putative Ig domain-containing protein n=1 Tax=Corallococcus carmarthensis TaxID=2316728 RepID=UPI00148B7EC8|nr:putative Ig domain-containing protein [Corallococcus carmarthensis]NOK15906.1 hypothetical protein [Corallococcus carmarthensis]
MSIARVVAALSILLLTACPGLSGPALPPDSGTRPDSGVADDGGIVDAPALSPQSLTPGEIGVPYQGLLSVSGGTAPFTWRPVLGAPVEGLTLSSDGALTGTPLFAGPGSFTVEVQDAGACARKGRCP